MAEDAGAGLTQLVVHRHTPPRALHFLRDALASPHTHHLPQNTWLHQTLTHSLNHSVGQRT